MPVWTLDGVEVILKERMSEPRVLAFLRSFVAASQLFDSNRFCPSEAGPRETKTATETTSTGRKRQLQKKKMNTTHRTTKE